MRDVPQDFAGLSSELGRAEKVAARIQQPRAEQRRKRRPLAIRRGGAQRGGNRARVRLAAHWVAGRRAPKGLRKVDLYRYMDGQRFDFLIAEANEKKSRCKTNKTKKKPVYSLSFA